MHKTLKRLNHGLLYTKNLLQREIEYREARPNDVMLFLTYRCSSRCKTCTMWKRPVNRTSELSLEEYKSFIDQLCDYGGQYRNVEMFGGDALLRKDVLIPLIRYVKEKGISRCSLPTNGNLLDAETARGLVDAGLDIVEVSIDSVNDVHDHMRGVDNTFERARDAIVRVLEARKGGCLPAVQVNCTISSMNVETFDQLLDFADGIGADTVAFEYVGEFPKDAVDASEIDGVQPSPYFVSENGTNLLSDSQADMLKDKIARIKNSPAKKRPYCMTMNIDVLSKKSLMTGRFPRKKCYMSHSLVTLDPYGNLLGCPFFDAYSIGNIREAPFAQIWKNDRHRLFMDHVNDPLRSPPLCDYCILSVERNPGLMTSFKRRLLYVNRHS